MSQENVRLVQACFEAWNANDMDALRDLHHPDAVAHPPDDWPEPGPFVGRDAVMRQFEGLREAFAVDTWEWVSDFVDRADKVAVRVIWTGAGSGPRADLEMTDVFEVRDGKICGLVCFWEHADALDALPPG